MPNMTPLNNIYKNQFFKSRERHLAWRAPIVCSRLEDYFPCKSVIDVGCAVGDLVATFSKMGLDSWGLEGATTALPHLMVPQSRVVVHDLRLPIIPPKTFDLVVCFEVAEHIEEEFAEQFVANLQALARHWLVVSAAPPGQGGTYHVNCRPEEYWHDLFEKAGFVRRDDLRDKFKQSLAPFKSKPGIKAYYNNVLAYEKPQ